MTAPTPCTLALRNAQPPKIRSVYKTWLRSPHLRHRIRCWWRRPMPRRRRRGWRFWRSKSFREESQGWIGLFWRVPRPGHWRLGGWWWGWLPGRGESGQRGLGGAVMSLGSVRQLISYQIAEWEWTTYLGRFLPIEMPWRVYAAASECGRSRNDARWILAWATRSYQD